jgi:hypothetical protein
MKNPARSPGPGLGTLLKDIFLYTSPVSTSRSHKLKLQVAQRSQVALRTGCIRHPEKYLLGTPPLASVQWKARRGFPAGLGHTFQACSIGFFEGLPAHAAEPADRPHLVEPLEQIADRCVQLGQAVEPLMAQSRQNPSRDDGNCRWLKISWDSTHFAGSARGHSQYSKGCELINGRPRRLAMSAPPPSAKNRRYRSHFRVVPIAERHLICGLLISCRTTAPALDFKRRKKCRTTLPD